MSGAKIVRLEFRGLHKAFGQLRSADRRSIVAAYRFGQVVDTLHGNGFTWDELGEELDRSKYTVAVYAKLYNKYDTEQDLLRTAESMKTYNVSKLAGHTEIVPVQYVLHCLNCGSYDSIKRERKQENTEVHPVPAVHFDSGATARIRSSN